jgi:hypothetical protein
LLYDEGDSPDGSRKYRYPIDQEVKDNQTRLVKDSQFKKFLDFYNKNFDNELARIQAEYRKGIFVIDNKTDNSSFQKRYNPGYCYKNSEGKIVDWIDQSLKPD